MDTGEHVKPFTNRADAIYGKVDLLAMLGRTEKTGETPIYRGAHEHRARQAPQNSPEGTLPVQDPKPEDAH
jgi:hypothetical protein